MVQHGSESYFVVGEGLLAESGEGRDAARAVASAAAAPPFRFSRMGPKGTGRQLGEPNRRKLGVLMAAGGGGTSQIPSGFTYLGQFLDHDLTFDKTTVMLGDDRLAGRSCCRPARRASTSTRSTAPARRTPSRPSSTRPTACTSRSARRSPPTASRPRPASTCRAAPGSSAKAKRRAIIPDPRNDENLAVAQTHAAMIRFHNRVLDSLPASVPARPALRPGARARHQALPVDGPHRLPAADLPPQRGRQRLQLRPQGVRGRRDADRRADDADRVLRRRLPARPLDDPRRLQLEPDLRRRLRHARLPVHVLGDQRQPRRRAAAAEQLDRRLPPPLRLRRGRPRRPQRAGGASSTARRRSTPTSSTRSPTCGRSRSAAPGSRRATRAATSPSAT